jgi:hypothetical protein
MSGEEPGTVRVHIYQTDPLITVADRVDADDEWSPYYEIPAALVEAYERAEKAYDLARDAITEHVEANHLAETDPQEQR